MNQLRDKYIDLLLKKCIYSPSKSLFISYDVSHADFIDRLVEKAREYGFDKFLFDQTDVRKEYQLLNDLSVDEIKTHPYFCRKIWDKAVEENCVFLLPTTRFSNYLDEIDSEKIKVVNQAKVSYQNKYFTSVMNDSISWTIFCLPNKLWATKLFPKEKDSYS